MTHVLAMIYDMGLLTLIAFESDDEGQQLESDSMGGGKSKCCSASASATTYA